MKAALDSFEADILAEMGAVFADIVDIQHGIAVGIFLAPVVILKAAAAVHDKYGRNQVKPLLDTFMSLVNRADPSQIDRKATGNLEQGVVHPFAIVIP